jgi:hypothetical protein
MSKKVATPEKRNLLLAEAQVRLEFWKQADARYEPEYGLLDRLLDKNTIQAARSIAEEFVARFGAVSGNVEMLTSKLLPSGRAGTWAELEERILRVCKYDKGLWERAHLGENRLDP